MSAASDLAAELADRDDAYATIAKDVVLAPKVGDLERVDQSRQEVEVTAYLSRARDDLARAVQMTGPAAVAAVKAQIATAAEATKQLGLSKEIQADAQEMVRRAEYALGKAIRAGQERGEIRKPGDDCRTDLVDRNNHVPKASPYDFASKNEMHGNGRGIADMADGVTEPEFEAALSDAKAEGNLSRANVVRKIHGVKSDRLTPVEKLVAVRKLADTGMTSGQIGDEIGASEAYVRNVARQNDIKIKADEVLRNKHRLRVDHNHIVSHLVMTLEVITEGLDRVDLDAVDEAQMQNWTDSLTTTTRDLKRFVDRMKEKVQ